MHGRGSCLVFCHNENLEHTLLRMMKPDIIGNLRQGKVERFAPARAKNKCSLHAILTS